MTNKETGDDESQALLEIEYNATHFDSKMTRDGFYAALAAAGYREHPEPEITEEQEAAMEQAAHRALDRLAKRGEWHEDDTAIGGQAAYIVRVILEAAALRVPVGEGEK